MTDEPTPRPGSQEPTPESTAEGGPAETPNETHLRELLRLGADGTQGDPFSAIFAVRTRVHRRRTGIVLGSAAAIAIAAAGLVVAQGGPAHSPRPEVAASRPAPGGQRTGELVSFNACSDYLDYVKKQALAEVGPYGLPTDGQLGYGNLGINQKLGAAAGGGVSPAFSIGNGAGSSAGSGAAIPSSAQASPGTSVDGDGTTPTFSSTDDQVAGVDEPDTVKTDGHVVVTLVGSTLRVLDLNAQVVGSLQLPGDTGGGMLLDGSQVVVLSSTSTTQPGTIGWVPDPAQGDTTGTPAGSTVQDEARVTVVDLSDPATPQIVRSFLLDGNIVAARLVDSQVRLVLRSDGPRLDFVTPSTTGDDQSATAINTQLIQDSSIADWLPYWQIQNPDGSTTARQPLSSCQSVARPQQASGLSTVTVLTLNPSTSAPGPATSVVAAGDTVYATADHLYVAGPSGTTSDPNPYSGASQSGCCAILPPSGASTAIYDFAMNSSGAPVFEGAGTVPGWLIDSYAMDEDAQGDLRVASTAQSSGGTTGSQITVLDLSGGQLVKVGSVGGLGNGEFIKTVRFIGDVAYVVTFQTFDPLYVVDLADPRDPALAGELDQPGFSEFLYPVSDQLLIGVGVELSNGEPSSLVVATYNVSNPAHPERVAASTLATGYQYVAGGYDPHAFLWWPATDLALLAIPADNQYGTNSLSSGIAAYQVGASGQLTHSATLSHGSTSTTRSAVIDGQVWAFSDSGVLTANLTDLPASTWHGY